MMTGNHRAQRSPARDLALIAVFAALIAVLGLPGMVMPFGGAVPITLQSLGVMLAGSILGGRRGAAAVLLLLALVAIGFPLLAGGRGGFGVFLGPSAGYLLGWVIGAGVIGWLFHEKLPHFGLLWALVANIIGGIVVIYAIGIPVQAYVTGAGLPAAGIAALAFVPGDMVKAIVASVVAVAVRRALPELTSSRPAVEKIHA